MAYIIPSKNPIDILSNNKAKIGISIPFSNTSVFNSTLSTKDQIKYNLINLLLTQKGEKLFEPLFGTNIRKYLFENNIDGIRNEITNSIIKYIPEVSIINIDLINEEHLVYITINYNIILTSEEDNISITFQ